ncbi:MAG: MlaD family protein [Candidatus Omnitrophota bacterium]
MKKYSNEFKVGLFVVLCLLGLAYLLGSTGKLNIKKDGYHIYVTFNEVAGLEKKAPVMLNGLEVGKVEDIKVSYDGNQSRILLKIWLDQSARVRENPTISIKTLGLMGEKYIQISSHEGENFIKPDSVFEGKPYLDMDALLEEAQDISKDIGGQINKLLESLNDTVDENQSSISAIVENLEATSKNFEEFSADIKRHPWKLMFRQKEK